MILHGIHFDQASLAAAAARAGVSRLYLFGSILTDRFSSSSDVDILVDIGPRPVGLLAMGELQMELSELLGRDVHLTLLSSVPSPDRPVLIQNARTLHAA